MFGCDGKLRMICNGLQLHHFEGFIDVGEFKGLRFGVWGLGFGVWGLEFRDYGLGDEGLGFGCRVWGSELRAGFRAEFCPRLQMYTCCLGFRG